VDINTTKNIDFYLGNFLIAVLRPFVILLSFFFKRDHKLELRRNITIVKLLGGGSLVIAYPNLLGLREKYPDLTINLVTLKRIAPFAYSLNVFDNVFEVDDSSIPKFLFSSIRTYVKTFGTDTIVSLEVYSKLATVFSVLTCARNRVGFYVQAAFWRKRIHTHLVYFSPLSGTFEFYDKIFQLFSVTPSSADECKERILKSLPKTDKTGKYRICIGHACSDLSRERMLDANQWEKVFVSRIDKSLNPEVVFLGSKKDSDLAAGIIRQLSPVFPDINFDDLCGKFSLNESLSVLNSCNEFWGIDSSLIHYARLFRIKSLSFWGPTNPKTLLRDMPGLKEEKIYCKIPCSPCIHITESPPCNGDNVCIQNLFEEKKRDWIGKVS
jgi:ADP-heptose:LPS heptosyltransferase